MGVREELLHISSAGIPLLRRRRCRAGACTALLRVALCLTLVCASPASPLSACVRQLPGADGPG